MFLPAWRCSMRVGDFLSMTSSVRCSTQVCLSCIFNLKHLCYHVQNWSFQWSMTSWHSLWTRLLGFGFWVLDWILDFEIFSDLNFGFWILNFEFWILSLENPQILQFDTVSEATIMCSWGAERALEYGNRWIWKVRPPGRGWGPLVWTKRG